MSDKPLRILFFVEPLIESEWLDFRMFWAQNFVRDMGETLRANTTRNVDMVLLANDYVVEKITDYPAKIVTVTQSLLRWGHKMHAQTVLMQAASGTLSPELIDHFGKIYKTALAGFEPDIIISWTPVPYLRAVFPKALILYSEASIFSRPPMPPTLFFDPTQPAHGAYVMNHLQELKGKKLPAPSQQLLDRLKDGMSSYLMSNAYQDERLQQMRQEHTTLVLLSLQMFDCYMARWLLGGMSAEDLIFNILAVLPSDVGLIVVEHPFERYIGADFLERVGKRHANLYMNLDWRSSSTPSDFVVPWVDLVLHAGSKVAFSAMFCGKKIVDLTLDKKYGLLADGAGIEAIGEVLAMPAAADKDALLHWMLTHYTLPLAYAKDPQWLIAFLLRALQHHESGQKIEDFYAPVDAEAKIYQLYADALATIAQN